MQQLWPRKTTFPGRTRPFAMFQNVTLPRCAPFFLWYSPLNSEGRVAVTIDEELNVLEDSLRRLKIEYDIYFGGGSKRPPADLEWRVNSLMKKFGENPKLSFPQRFRYNSLANRYALFSDLWRQKLKIKEEGYRRPQDKNLSIQGMRTEEERAAAAALEGDVAPAEAGAFKVVWSDPDSEGNKVKALFDAVSDARTKSGDANAGSANYDSFKSFVKKKTEQIRKDYGCHSVEYSVEVESGQVRLKAKAKI